MGRAAAQPENARVDRLRVPARGRTRRARQEAALRVSAKLGARRAARAARFRLGKRSVGRVLSDPPLKPGPKGPGLLVSIAYLHFSARWPPRLRNASASFVTRSATTKSGITSRTRQRFLM